MDYKTKPLSRKNIRTLSMFLRRIFDMDLIGSVDVISMLDKLSSVFDKCTYDIVEDNELPISNPAVCEIDGNDYITIRIKNSVYEGAILGIGAYRDHIVHEICHVFL
ncbi:MAG: hypothetical protein Q4C49_11990 [Bacillota bacterium]|nr:hypothetical protein [Bacillota bacterium]